MKIKFIPFIKDAGISGILPVPAVNAIPKWFTKIPRFTNDDKKLKLFSNGKQNTTVKWCSPFLDSLTAGYMILLDTDIMVTKQESGTMITWLRGGEVISLHSTEQISLEQVPPGYSSQPYKFANNWSIETPKGYSALFVHPLNRTDLPFYSLSGFVDTDEYNIPVNFPFLIRDDFEGIIEAGTPIAQIIPIRRESWTHSIGEFTQEYADKKIAKFHTKIYRAYKNLYWNRKDYR